MYKLNQYSLKEYELINDHTSDIYYVLKRFNEGNYEVIGEVLTLPVSASIKIVLPNDGIYSLSISDNIDFNDPVSIYTIHNITELLNKRQKFLTDTLIDCIVDTKNHNHYYDFTAYNILLDSYIKLVHDTFITTYTPKNLYKIEYLFNMLQKY